MDVPKIQLFTPSLSCSVSIKSDMTPLDLTPTPSLTSSPSLNLTPPMTTCVSLSSFPALPPLPVTPIVLPIPMIPITFGVSGNEQLNQWMNQILVNGMHNLGQLEKFLVSRESQQ